MSQENFSEMKIDERSVWNVIVCAAVNDPDKPSYISVREVAEKSGFQIEKAYILVGCLLQRGLVEVNYRGGIPFVCARKKEPHGCPEA